MTFLVVLFVSLSVVSSVSSVAGPVSPLAQAREISAENPFYGNCLGILVSETSAIAASVYNSSRIDSHGCHAVCAEQLLEIKNKHRCPACGTSCTSIPDCFQCIDGCTMARCLPTHNQSLYSSRGPLKIYEFAFGGDHLTSKYPALNSLYSYRALTFIVQSHYAFWSSATKMWLNELSG